LQFFVPGDLKGIKGEGMPIYKNPFEKGNLYIKFDVTFPSNNFADETKLKVKFPRKTIKSGAELEL
jgi:DnaJ-class molecular chaperone